MAMASSTSSSQPNWVPYEPIKDCSQGFCSIYCPQWCYFSFPPPPPPPFDLAGAADGDSAGTTSFSPLVIAIIGVLASAFLLVSYYAIVSKSCGTFDSLRHRVFGQGTDGGARDTDDAGGGFGHEMWHASPSDGLDEASIDRITAYKYRRGEGLVEGTDCSVCLGEFRDGESLRLLPKCSHAFHLQCIDVWLRSHSNCPLCRASVVSVAATAPPQLPASREQVSDSSHVEQGRGTDEMVIVIEDPEAGMEEEAHLVNDGDHEPKEEANARVEIREEEVWPDRRSTTDSSGGRVMRIADVLQASMEDELLAAKESGLLACACSSRQCQGEQMSSRASSHCRAPMKRSLSSGKVLRQ